jgi:hypothetical protein
LAQRPSGVEGGAVLQGFVCRQSPEAPNGPPGKKVARNVKNVPVKWALNPAPKIPTTTRSDRHRARPRAGLICLTIVVDEIDVPSCSPALNKSLDISAGFILCRRNFAGIGRKKILGTGGRGIARKKERIQRTMLSETAGTAISQVFVENTRYGNRGKFEISSAVGPRAKGLWVPPKPLFFIWSAPRSNLNITEKMLFKNGIYT